MPAAVDPTHVLALLTRVRAARAAAGEISAARLHDVRAYKSAVAELGYLRRLAAAGRTGGTAVTSMPQLVQGLAALHPAWRLDGDPFHDRDRHHRAVRRRLRDLDAMGLLAWRIGVDIEGEDARTELELRPAPDITDDELAAARAQLARWKRRYGAALNTGSRTGIRNAARHARPLPAGERARRGIRHARSRAAARQRPLTTNTAPPSGAPATPENTLRSDQPTGDQNAGSPRAGARPSMVTRSSDPIEQPLVPRPEAPQTTSLTEDGPGAALDHFEASRAARFAAAEAVRAARAPVFDEIAAQSARRAGEVASWGLDRGWPADRLREAFCVWRHGAREVAEHSWGAAGPLTSEDVARLRRAVGRYERHVAARPDGYPVGGLAALAEITATAAERSAQPRRLHYAIRALDQLSRRMRASDSVDDADRLARAARRAKRRAQSDNHDRNGQGEPLRLYFRIPGPAGHRWPAWVAVDTVGDPLLVDGELVVRDAFRARPGYERQPWVAPPQSSQEYRDVLRDAHLLRGLWPPPQADGRTAMAQSDDRAPDILGARRARPGPYALPEHWRDKPDPADLELARLAPAIGLRRVQRLDVDVRDQLLDELRARARAETAERTDVVQYLRDLDPGPNT